MKIASVNSLLGDSPKREKRENPNSKKEQSPQPEEFARVVSENEETIEAAAQSFSEDPLAKAQGLSADLHGKGPGLRVMLKDGTGAVIRQFTGEEFVQLRQAASGTPRGKLLDKKL